MLHLFAVLALFVARVAGLHIFLGENGQASCFYLTLGKDTLLSEQHSAWELEKETNKWIRDDTLQVEVTIDERFDSNHRVYQHQMGPFSEFQFVAEDGGDHKICYRALVDSWWANNKVKLEVDFVSSAGRDIIEPIGEQKLGYLAKRVSDLGKKLFHISKEQNMLRDREAAFRDISERTNSRVAWMTIFQIIVLGATCTWQVSHLKSFFVKQKLV